jgi:hypothetical protein
VKNIFILSARKENQKFRTKFVILSRINGKPPFPNPVCTTTRKVEK